MPHRSHSDYEHSTSQSWSQGNSQESEVVKVDLIKRSDSSADSEPTSIDAQARTPTRAPISIATPSRDLPIPLRSALQKPIGTSDRFGRE